MREFAYIHEEGAVPQGLKGIPFLAHFERAHLDDILYSSCIIECDAGDAVIEEGVSGSRIYILTSGKSKFSKKASVWLCSTPSGTFLVSWLPSATRCVPLRFGPPDPPCFRAVDQKFLQDIKPKHEHPAFYSAFYEFLGRSTAQRLRATSDMLSRMEARVADLEAELEAIRSLTTV